VLVHGETLKYDMNMSFLHDCYHCQGIAKALQNVATILNILSILNHI
jgi:hypothetical protein